MLWTYHLSFGKDLIKEWQNNNWFLKYPGSRVHHLHCSSSGHSPLLINLSGLDPPPRKKIFKFEEMWLSNERCVEIVEASWSSFKRGTSDSEILNRIDRYGKDLSWWNRNIFLNVRRELVKKKDLLAQAETATTISGQNHKVRELKDEIIVLLDREAYLWSQRSRVLWLKKGDGNTKKYPLPCNSKAS